MKLKAVLPSLDGIPEALQPAYTEKDGSFYLNIEGVVEHPDVKGLQTSLTAARKDAKTATTALNDLKTKYADLPEDFDADLYHAALDGGKDIGKQLTEQRTRLTKEKDVAVAAVQTKLDATTGRLTKVVSESVLNNALVESGVAPEMMKPVKAMFAQNVKVDFEGDEPIVTIEGLPVADKVKAWAGTDEGKHFVRAPDNNGGGSRQNGPGGAVTDYSKLTTTELQLAANKGDKKAEAEQTRRVNDPIKTTV